MSIFSKSKVSVAAESLRPFNFMSRHITTTDFFQLQPVYHKEVVPGQSIDIDVRSFARTKALSVPTFGDAKLNLRAFFVPMRTIYRGWDDFITDAMHVNSGSQYATHDEMVPYIQNSQFLDLFRKEVVSTTITTGTSDFIVYTSQETGGDIKKRFTAFGRQIYKILNALGYVVNPYNSNLSTYSALPLLSFLRVYLDWYYPSQYYGDTASALLHSLCVRDTSQDPSFNAERLLSIFKVICYVMYGDDYFTSAFDTPVGPTSEMNSRNIGIGASSFDIPDQNVTSSRRIIDDFSSSVMSGNSSNSLYYPNTPFIASNQESVDLDDNLTLNNFTQFTLDTLKALTDFMKRHQLVGARAFERFAARFGYELPASKLNRSVYLGHHTVPMMVQDVMSTADTENAALGDYAGKGIVAGDDGHFHLDNQSEFGYFIICASLVPEIGYYQGVDRKVKHLTKLDFFSPEFDSLGTQPVTKDELYVPQNDQNPQDDAGFIALQKGIFGFMPKYAEYKVPRNLLTGDFRCESLSLSGDTSDAWHLFRKFTGNSFVSTDEMVHSRSFISPYPLGYPIDLPSIPALESGDGYQFDRIFDQTSPELEDHFVFIFYFKEKHMLPMKPLWDTYEFKDEDKHAQRVVDVNGLKFD